MQQKKTFCQRLLITKKIVLEVNTSKEYQRCKYRVQYCNDRTNIITYQFREYFYINTFKRIKYRIKRGFRYKQIEELQYRYINAFDNVDV